MLSAGQLVQARRRGAPTSLAKQQYQTYLLQRIESFKDGIPREELLALGGEAVEEIQSGGQFLLTEILLAESVDKLIQRRLRLPSYRKWRSQFAALRKAQRGPIHWGIDPAGAPASLLPWIEPEDQELVVGSGAQAEACLLAAHEAEVTFLDEDMSVVEQVEARIYGEALVLQLRAWVAVLGEWLPPLTRELDLVVADASTLGGLSHGRRQGLLEDLRSLTRPGGVHVIVPGDGPRPVTIRTFVYLLKF